MRITLALVACTLALSAISCIAQDSTTGNWKQLADGPWGKREGHMAVSFNDYIYLIGGRNDFSFYNDIWRTKNGDSWEQITDTAAFGKRSYHILSVFNGYIYLMGGQTLFSFYNDVWRSADGVNWEQVTDHADWSPRAGLAATVKDNSLWVVGGCENNPPFRKLYNDVWKSDDGKTWTQVTAAAPFAPRSGPRLIDFQGQLLLIAGEHGFSNDTQYNDVWSSTDGATWTQVLGDAPWRNRSGHGVVQYQEKIYVIAGFIYLHDMWESADGGATWTLTDNTAFGCDPTDLVGTTKCGRYDFWSLTHKNDQGVTLLYTLGGSNSDTTFFNQFADTWAYNLDSQPSLVELQ
jgi:N-acetylneuraminic acid mutarotase